MAETADREGREDTSPDLAAPLLAIPDTGRGRGVLVLGAAGGALEAEACARLARHGFVALAPRLPGADPDAPISAAERAAVDAAIHALFCEHASDGPRVGLLGFGRGARLALDAAARGGRLAAVVSIGRAPERTARSNGDAEIPILAILAEKDEAVAAGRAAELAERLRAEAPACTLRIEPGVALEYLDPARPDHYDAVAARASWDAALARFRAEL
jgi:dienelactone hydrolase